MGNHKDVAEDDDVDRVVDDFFEVMREMTSQSPLSMKMFIEQMRKVDPFVMPNIRIKLQPPMGFTITRIAAKSSYGGKDGAGKK